LPWDLPKARDPGPAGKAGWLKVHFMKSGFLDAYLWKGHELNENNFERKTF
jgi:hypothetical protein